MAQSLAKIVLESGSHIARNSAPVGAGVDISDGAELVVHGSTSGIHYNSNDKVVNGDSRWWEEPETEEEEGLASGGNVD